MNKYNEAINKNTSKKTLEKLAKNSDEYVRWEVARNTSTPSKTLEELSKDSKIGVRYGVAWNTSTSSKTLADLAKDSNVGVRCGVAWNTSASSKTLEELSRDSNVGVRREAQNTLKNKPKRKEFDMKKFYLVVQASCENVRGSYKKLNEAIEQAQRLTADEDDIFIVMQPHKAFQRPKPNVEEVTLED